MLKSVRSDLTRETGNIRMYGSETWTRHWCFALDGGGLTRSTPIRSVDIAVGCGFDAIPALDNICLERNGSSSSVQF